MRIIVDSNRIISALIKDGISREILSSRNIEFFTIEFVFEEVSKHRGIVAKKSGMTREQIDTLFRVIMNRITTIPEREVQANMKQAKNVMNQIDPNDAPFIAAALAISNDGIWSHDKHFTKQTKVKCYLASDLVKYI